MRGISYDVAANNVAQTEGGERTPHSSIRACLCIYPIRMYAYIHGYQASFFLCDAALGVFAPPMLGIRGKSEARLVTPRVKSQESGGKERKRVSKLACLKVVLCFAQSISHT